MTRGEGKRSFHWLLFTIVAACGPSNDPPPDMRATEEYTSPIVLLVSPDSSEVENLRAERGEDFYIIADDAMWYRALTYELLDSLGIPHAEVGRGEARFMVQQTREVVSWEATPYSWFTIVYDGLNEPVLVPDVDIRGPLAGMTKP